MILPKPFWLKATDDGLRPSTFLRKGVTAGAMAASRFFQSCCMAPSGVVEAFEEACDALEVDEGGARGADNRNQPISPVVPVLTVPPEYAKFDHRIQKVTFKVMEASNRPIPIKYVLIEVQTQIIVTRSS